MSDHDATYAIKLKDLLALSPEDNRTVIDVGAHRGQFSRMILGDFPAAKVFAVEADAELCTELGETFRNNANVTISNFAMHEASAELDFHVHQDKGTSSLLHRPSESRRYFHSADRVVATRSVQAGSLDDFIADNRLTHVDLLKLDTQGAEGPILRGAAEALGAALIDIIYTEFFVVPHYSGAALLHELWQQLADHRYVLYDLFKGPYGRNGQLRFGDAIFVSDAFSRKYLDNFPVES